MSRVPPTDPLVPRNRVWDDSSVIGNVYEDMSVRKETRENRDSKMVDRLIRSILYVARWSVEEKEMMTEEEWQLVVREMENWVEKEIEEQNKQLVPNVYTHSKVEMMRRKMMAVVSLVQKLPNLVLKNLLHSPVSFQEIEKKSQQAHSIAGDEAELVLTLLGCGTSRSAPTLEAAVENPQLVFSEERRHNPSLLLQVTENHDHHVKATHQYIIDVGKTFRSSMLAQLERNVLDSDAIQLLPTFDAFFISHAHSDACMGLDDIREFGESIIISDSETTSSLEKIFGYILNSKALPSTKYFVPKGQSKILNAYERMHFDSWTMIAVPLWHGVMECMGYVIQGKNKQVVYFSDLQSEHENDPLSCFRDRKKTIDILRELPISHFYIDALWFHGHYPSHASWKEACEILTVLEHNEVNLCETECIAIGMDCQISRSWFKKTGPHRLIMGYEGMKIRIKL